MKKTPILRSAVVSAAAWLALGPARADNHLQQALKYTEEAVRSAGDSQAIGAQTEQALKHVQDAKRAHVGNREALEHLEKCESYLDAAETNARRYNASAAIENAEEARFHLQQAEKAVGKVAGSHPR